MSLKKTESKHNISLKKHTTIKIGGTAKYFFIVNAVEALAELVKKLGDAFYILGAGSNLLIKDGQLDKPVIKLGRNFDYVKKRDYWEIGAATSLPAVLNYTLKNQLGGLENLAGIPATVGGLLLMNASSFGGQISSCVEKVEVMDRKGEVYILNADQIKFNYRRSSLKEYIILRGGFKLTENKEAKEKIKSFLETRFKQQDFDYPSCGCIFKNPLSAAAGFLIDTCGLKGTRKNQAQVSNKHANFIVNLGGASFNDVDYLIKLIKDKVSKKHNVMLEEEICRWE